MDLNSSFTLCPSHNINDGNMKKRPASISSSSDSAQQQTQVKMSSGNENVLLTQQQQQMKARIIPGTLLQEDWSFPSRQYLQQRFIGSGYNRRTRAITMCPFEPLVHNRNLPRNSSISAFCKVNHYGNDCGENEQKSQQLSTNKQHEHEKCVRTLVSNSIHTRNMASGNADDSVSDLSDSEDDESSNQCHHQPSRKYHHHQRQQKNNTKNNSWKSFYYDHSHYNHAKRVRQYQIHQRLFRVVQENRCLRRKLLHVERQLVLEQRKRKNNERTTNPTSSGSSSPWSPPRDPRISVSKNTTKDAILVVSSTAPKLPK